MVIIERGKANMIKVLHMTCDVCESKVRAIVGDPEVEFEEGPGVFDCDYATWTCPVCKTKQQSFAANTEAFPLEVEERFSTSEERAEMAMWSK